MMSNIHLFPVKRHLCWQNCSCFYNYMEKANVLSCSDHKGQILPEELPNGTNWVEIYNSTIKDLCGEYQYSNNVTRLLLPSNDILSICQSFVHSLQNDRHLEVLDLSSNQLQSIPIEIQNLKYIKMIYVAKNPFLCNCDMLWMIGWLANFTSSSGKHIVADYQNVTCATGPMNGKQIYKLNRVEMGCYPERMPSWEIALLVISGIFIISTAVILFLLFRWWNEVKFWIYKNFDILGKTDKEENLNGINWDCLLSYR